MSKVLSDVQVAQMSELVKGIADGSANRIKSHVGSAFWFAETYRSTRIDKKDLAAQFINDLPDTANLNSKGEAKKIDGWDAQKVQAIGGMAEWLEADEMTSIFESIGVGHATNLRARIKDMKEKSPSDFESLIEGEYSAKDVKAYETDGVRKENAAKEVDNSAKRVKKWVWAKVLAGAPALIKAAAHVAHPSDFTSGDKPEPKCDTLSDKEQVEADALYASLDA